MIVRRTWSPHECLVSRSNSLVGTTRICSLYSSPSVVIPWREPVKIKSIFDELIRTICCCESRGSNRSCQSQYRPSTGECFVSSPLEHRSIARTRRTCNSRPDIAHCPSISRSTPRTDDLVCLTTSRVGGGCGGSLSCGGTYCIGVG